MTQNAKQYRAVLAGIVLCLLYSFSAAYLTRSTMWPWYGLLNKPAFNPPPWIFGPVWTVLYIMLGIVLGQVWIERKRFPLLWGLFIGQLGVNFLWTPLFFGWHCIGWAFVDLVVMHFLTVLFMVGAWQRDKRTWVWLCVPYVCWITFAGVLNFYLYRMN